MIQVIKFYIESQQFSIIKPKTFRFYNVNRNLNNRDVIDTIKNVESMLNILSIDSTIKDKIRHNITNNLKNCLNKKTNLPVYQRKLLHDLRITKKFINIKIFLNIFDVFL